MRMGYLRKPEKRGNPSKRHPIQKEVKPDSTFVPLIPDGEDEASLQRHKKKLKEEMKKVSPSKTALRELMKRTFPLRRREILEGKGAVSEIILLYPALKFPDEVQIIHSYLT